MCSICFTLNAANANHTNTILQYKKRWKFVGYYFFLSAPKAGIVLDKVGAARPPGKIAPAGRPWKKS